MKKIQKIVCLSIIALACTTGAATAAYLRTGTRYRRRKHKGNTGTRSGRQNPGTVTAVLGFNDAPGKDDASSSSGKDAGVVIDATDPVPVDPKNQFVVLKVVDHDKTSFT